MLRTKLVFVLLVATSLLAANVATAGSVSSGPKNSNSVFGIDAIAHFLRTDRMVDSCSLNFAHVKLVRSYDQHARVSVTDNNPPLSGTIIPCATGTDVIVDKSKFLEYRDKEKKQESFGRALRDLRRSCCRSTQF